jgi:NAD dependent epimerase/dehydratase family enzyme
MFKKSDDNPQLDIFSSPTEYFRDSKKKKYLKNDSRHNRFRNQVVMRVDESVFNVLYIEGQGASQRFDPHSGRHDDPQRGPGLE